MDQTFHLKVLSREGKMYEADVVSITSYNEKGKFDVLARHANFISLISRGLTIIDAKGLQNEIKFDNALLKVHENQVEVYVGIEGIASTDLTSLHTTGQTAG